MILTNNLAESMARCQAMIELLADNRILAEMIFDAMPDTCLERFEECLLRVSKYIENVEKKED